MKKSMEYFFMISSMDSTTIRSGSRTKLLFRSIPCMKMWKNGMSMWWKLIWLLKFFLLWSNRKQRCYLWWIEPSPKRSHKFMNRADRASSRETEIGTLPTKLIHIFLKIFQPYSNISIMNHQGSKDTEPLLQNLKLPADPDAFWFGCQQLWCSVIDPALNCVNTAGFFN